MGQALYSFDLTEFKSLISISLPSYSSTSSAPTPLLNVILIYEEPSTPPSTTSELEQPREEASWTFLRLESAGSGSPGNGFDALRAGGISSKTEVKKEGKWFKSLQEAVEAVTKPSYSKNRPSPMDFHSHQSEEEGDYDEYGTRRPLTEWENGRGEKGGVTQMKTREEMSQGEGTTPGAYGDSADFWAGWSDSEGEEEDEKGAELERGRGRDTEKEEEENYWRNYGNVEDQIDTGRNQEEEEEVQQSPTIPQLEPARPAQTKPESTQPNLAKTRSRRSSTVTPFSTKAFLSTPPPLTPSSSAQNPQPSNSQTSFLSMQDSPAQTSQPFQPLPSHANSTVSTNKGDENGTTEKEEEYLRFALAGIWGMFGKGNMAEIEERKKRFERIVGEVLRS